MLVSRAAFARSLRVSTRTSRRFCSRKFVGVLDSPPVGVLDAPVGTAEVEFTSCTEALSRYDLPDDGETGEIDRLAPDVFCGSLTTRERRRERLSKGQCPSPGRPRPTLSGVSLGLGR